jgi:hypothetical protein
VSSLASNAGPSWMSYVRRRGTRLSIDDPARRQHPCATSDLGGRRSPWPSEVLRLPSLGMAAQSLHPAVPGELQQASPGSDRAWRVDCRPWPSCDHGLVFVDCKSWGRGFRPATFGGNGDLSGRATPAYNLAGGGYSASINAIGGNSEGLRNTSSTRTRNPPEVTNASGAPLRRRDRIISSALRRFRFRLCEKTLRQASP